MPWKVGEVVKVRRSIPQRIGCGGRLRRRMVEVGGVDIVR